MALYHKHRPQKFLEIVGQEHIVRTISNQVAGNKVAHAYLFSGPRGIGKTTMARILAKAVNCPNRKDHNFEPCNACNYCQEITNSRAIDVIEIDAASHTGVDNVRENIIENAQFKPTKSKYKVFIIDEVHMLSTSAFNALLKTLEEPPNHVLFILATTELHKLPETIISRCQRFNFHKISYDNLKKYLKKVTKMEKVKIDEEVLDRIINKSDGCVRDAISLLDQIMATGEKTITSEIAGLVLPTSNVEETLQFVTLLVNRDIKSGLELVNNLAESGIDLLQLSHDTIELLRMMMVTKADAKATGLGLDLSEKVKKELQKLNKNISYIELVQLIDLMMKRRLEIKSAPLPQLPLEMAIIEWCCNNEGLEASLCPELGPRESQPLSRARAEGKPEVDDNNMAPPNTSETNNNLPSNLPQNKPQTKEKKSIKERVRKLVSKEASFSLKDLQAKWNEFIEKLEQDSPSLVFILKMTQIDSIQGNVIKLAVPYNFHKDKLTEKHCQGKLEALLAKLLGGKVKLDICIQRKETAQDKQELQELASVLGGELIS